MTAGPLAGPGEVGSAPSRKATAGIGSLLMETRLSSVTVLSFQLENSRRLRLRVKRRSLRPQPNRIGGILPPRTILGGKMPPIQKCAQETTP